MAEPASKRQRVAANGTEEHECASTDENGAAAAAAAIASSDKTPSNAPAAAPPADVASSAAPLAGVQTGPQAGQHLNDPQSSQLHERTATALQDLQQQWRPQPDAQQRHQQQQRPPHGQPHGPSPPDGQQQAPLPPPPQQQQAANPVSGPQQQQQEQPIVAVPVGAYSQREEHMMRQETSGEIEFAYVVNDGQPINMIRLMGLKVIFSKQLPNMPKEYICRLLLDRRHRSCALVAKNGQVLGGITYRIFPQQGFGEIAFCAVAASQQVRGFGTRLMNHTKAMARDRDSLSYFLTYADNNAVGYFTKQGFTREITLPRERWVGFIKDYDGGTLMECIIHPKVPYTDLVNLFRVQKEFLDGQIRQLSNSHVVHPGIPRRRLPMPPPGHARVKDLPVPINPTDIPGVKEAGWNPSSSKKAGYRLLLRDNSVVEPTHDNLHNYMGELLSALVALDESWPFRAPVDAAEALDYYDIIMDPVDLSLIAGRLAGRQYYISLEMFVADVRKMCDNCKYYNAQSTPYYQCAVKVQAFMESYLDNTITKAGQPPPPA